MAKRITRRNDGFHLFVGTAVAMEEWRRRNELDVRQVSLASLGARSVQGRQGPIKIIYDGSHDGFLLSLAEMDAIETAQQANRILTGTPELEEEDDV